MERQYQVSTPLVSKLSSFFVFVFWNDGNFCSYIIIVFYVIYNILFIILTLPKTRVVLSIRLQIILCILLFLLFYTLIFFTFFLFSHDFKKIKNNKDKNIFNWRDKYKIIIYIMNIFFTIFCLYIYKSQIEKYNDVACWFTFKKSNLEEKKSIMHEKTWV